MAISVHVQLEFVGKVFIYKKSIVSYKAVLKSVRSLFLAKCRKHVIFFSREKQELPTNGKEALFSLSNLF